MKLKDKKVHSEALITKKPATKAKSRTHKSELELLREENRNLKSEVRNLKKRLSRANKQQHHDEEVHEFLQDYLKQEEHDVNNVCPDCGRNTLTEVNLGPRILYVCNECRYRRTKK